ncbi:transporter substrate-binding domain-containing protein [Azospirillum halopraeferens]|uniref:transporter substrate-binding domain-containing protein n=1 Tax=Azospirillum halopraeferens TaxID=34010 RepID=UPI00048B4B02|nr:transporter substrate-binding domain-containing protein [Azospirillum halopraeferens]
MKKTVAALAFGAILAIAVSPAAAQDKWSKIRIATEGAYAPWNATAPSGELIGFEVDLARELCRKMNAECQILAQDWDGIIPALQQGKYDVIMAGMSITDERKQVIDFAGPYGSEPTAFATIKGSALAGMTFDLKGVDLATVEPQEQQILDALAKALEGKTVGVQTSTIQANFMERLLPQVRMRTYGTLDEAGIDLVNGRLDAMLGDRSAAQEIVKKEESLTMFGPNFVRGVLGEGVGAGLRQRDQDLKAKLNAAIAEANGDGTIARLSEQWFGYDISVK